MWGGGGGAGGIGLGATCTCDNGHTWSEYIHELDTAGGQNGAWHMVKDSGTRLSDIP